MTRFSISCDMIFGQEGYDFIRSGGVWRKRKENQKFASQLRIYGVICVYGHSAPLSTSPVVDSSKLAPVYDPEADRFTRSNFIKKTCLTNLISRRGFGLPIARSPVVSSWYIDRSTPA
jgi:hypothetical protein